MNHYSRLGTVCLREESEEMSIDGINLTAIWNTVFTFHSVCMQSMMSNPFGEIARRRFN
jgi:hypothetical protein